MIRILSILRARVSSIYGVSDRKVDCEKKKVPDRDRWLFFQRQDEEELDSGDIEMGKKGFFSRYKKQEYLWDIDFSAVAESMRLKLCVFIILREKVLIR